MSWTCSHDDCARTTNVLAFPDLYCWRHIPAEQRDLLADLDQRAPGIGVKPGCWPYGPNIDVVARRRMVEWAEHHQLRESKAARLCLHWITRGRCGVSMCREDRNTYGWMDHVTAWNRGGKAAVLACQPYPNVDIVAVADVAREHGLQLRVGTEGWYGHGTVWLALWSPEAAEHIVCHDFWKESATDDLAALLATSDVWVKAAGEREAFVSSLTVELARREGLADVIPIRPGG